MASDVTRGATEKGRRSDGSDPIIVKKYANRRLYNTATSSYVTLENLRAMVRGQQDFVVLDAKTNEDITRSVLTQIIFDEESRGQALLPTSVLRQLIRLYGDTLQGYVPGYLEMTMQAFERNQETFREHMKRSFGATPGYAELEEMTRNNIEMFRKTFGMFAPIMQASFDSWSAQLRAQRAADDASAEVAAAKKAAAAPGDASAAPAPTAPATPPQEVAELKRQLAEMQRKIDALS